MNQIKHKRTYTLLTITIAFLIPGLAVAQGQLPGGVQDVPIDGGLSLVLAAGAGYLVKRRHDARKKKAA